MASCMNCVLKSNCIDYMQMLLRAWRNACGWMCCLIFMRQHANNIFLLKGLKASCWAQCILLTSLSSFCIHVSSLRQITGPIIVFLDHTFEYAKMVLQTLRNGSIHIPFDTANLERDVCIFYPCKRLGCIARAYSVLRLLAKLSFHS